MRGSDVVNSNRTVPADVIPISRVQFRVGKIESTVTTGITATVRFPAASATDSVTGAVP